MAVPCLDQQRQGRLVNCIITTTKCLLPTQKKNKSYVYFRNVFFSTKRKFKTQYIILYFGTMAAKANTPTTEEETHLLTVKGIYYACGAQKRAGAGRCTGDRNRTSAVCFCIQSNSERLGIHALLLFRGSSDTKHGRHKAWSLCHSLDGSGWPQAHVPSITRMGPCLTALQHMSCQNRQKLLCSKDKRTLTIDTSVTDYVPRMFGTIVQVANLTGRLAVHNGKFVRITQLPDMTAAVDTTHIPKLGGHYA